MVSGRSSEYWESGVGTQHAHAQCATAQEHAIKFQARHKGSAARGHATKRLRHKGSAAQEHATKCQAKHYGVQRSAAPTCRISPTCKVELPAFRLQHSTTNADILKITPAVVLMQLCLVEDTGVSLLRSDAMVVQVLSRTEGTSLGCLFSAFSVRRRHTIQC